MRGAAASSGRLQHRPEHFRRTARDVLPQRALDNATTFSGYESDFAG
jgi:hypothetical protein